MRSSGRVLRAICAVLWFCVSGEGVFRTPLLWCTPGGRYAVAWVAVGALHGTGCATHAVPLTTFCRASQSLAPEHRHGQLPELHGAHGLLPHAAPGAGPRHQSVGADHRPLRTPDPLAHESRAAALLRPEHSPPTPDVRADRDGSRRHRQQPAPTHWNLKVSADRQPRAAPRP